MTTYPVRVRADRTALPGRWLWLVKWLLLIPHYLVLAVLWVAFGALTVVAYIAVLITGHYPAAIHGFTTGVLRWTWRVGFYGYTMLGTDRYPPFTLHERPDYPADLTFGGPPRLPRWLPLVAWLLALPHLLIVGALAGAGWQASRTGDDGTTLGVAAVALLIAAVALLFTGRYPAGLYDLLAGIARWWLRVVAYLTLLTGAYPPFRLDQGERDPDLPPDPPGPSPVVAASAPAAAPSSARTGGVVGKAVTLLAGVLLLMVGGGVVAAGGLTLAVNAGRQDGYVSTSTMHLSTQTAAITAEGMYLDSGGRWMLDLSGLDQVRIHVNGQRPLFVGIAHQSDVEGRLNGAGHDQLVQPAAGSRSDVRRMRGPVRDVPAPVDEPFWVASATGSGPITLDWSLSEGTYAVVLANADGRVDVTADVRASASVPNLAPLGFTVLGIGILIALAALALIYTGAAGLGARPPTAPPTMPPGGPPSAPRPPLVAPPAPESPSPRPPVPV